MTDSAGYLQSPAKCQFCEESEEIKWICFKCNLKLCGICNRKIHSKLETNQNHRVIALKEINSEETSNTRRRIDFEKLTCQVHKGQKSVSFCLDCHVTLCLTCHEYHTDHNKKELEKLYIEKAAEIQKVKQDINDTLPLVINKETKLTKISQEKSEQFKRVNDDIDKREAEIIAEVKKYSQKLHNEVDQVYQPILTKIQKNLSEVKRMKVLLKEKKDIVDNILNSHQACDVLDYSNTRDIPVTQKSEDIPTTRCLFNSADSLDSKVRQIFGELNRIPELQVVNTYKTMLKGVRNVIDQNENEKIISSCASKKLHRVKFDNDTMTVIKKKNIKVYDMALMGNGNVVISSNGRTLKIYTKEGTIKPYKSFLRLYTLGVHVNRHNEVLVGLSETKAISVTSNSISKVVLLNQSGDIQHTYQYTRNEQKIFTRPCRIVNCRDIICVVDELNDSCEGRLVSLDYGGHIQWVYNGEGNDKQDKFYPLGIAVTPMDLILVADDPNQNIHVLNAGGQIIVCHQVEDLGIEGPLSLCIDNEGLLWVGCRKGGR